VLEDQKASTLKGTVEERLMMEYLFVQNLIGSFAHYEGLRRVI
jgi:hypothetical protein